MSLPILILCILFLIPSISHVSLGSHYCMSDCNINGQREASQYELMCCDPLNMGRYIQLKEDDTNRYISCPSSIPDWCNDMRSCSDILITNPNATSGYYNLIITNGSTISVYCDMEGSNCGGEGGWTRIAFINMSEPGTTCPTGLTEKQYDNIAYNLCVNNYLSYNQAFGCNSTFFSSYTLNYTKICGRLRGYTHGHGFSFFNYYHNPNVSISEQYLSGVSITHDNKHIWSYVNGYEEDYFRDDLSCPCSSGNPTPPFVGNDYYCESGAPNSTYPFDILFINDPLWDGQQCNSDESTCCTTHNMPWFIKTLNETVSDDIQLRVCGLGCVNNSCSHYYYDTPLDLIELYIK